MPETRLDKLLAMLAKSPQDTFLLYAAAMEYRKADDADRAIEYLDRVLAVDADYAYAYFQKGELLQKQGRREAARATFAAGVEAARRRGDAKAISELSSALEMASG